MDTLQGPAGSSNGWAAPGGASAPGGSYLHIKIASILRRVWTRRRLFASIVFLGIVFSVVWALTRPIRFTSTTTLMPPDSSSSSSSSMGMISTLPIANPLLAVRTPSALFIAILSSRNIQDSLVADYDLVHRFKKGSEEDAAAELAKSAKFKDDNRSGTVTISVEAPDPHLAQELADGYVKELNAFVTRNSTSAAHRERVFLEERLKQLKLDMDSSAQALSQFSAKNKTIDIPSQNAATLTYEARLRADLQSARAELASLQQVYTNDNVRVLSVKARITELEGQLSKTIGTSQSGDLSSTDSPSIAELPSLSVTYADLSRSVREKELVWETLTKEYETARVQEDKEIPTVRVLDPAKVPNVRSAPARATIVGFGTFISVLVALVLVLIVSTWKEMDPQTEPKKLVFEMIDTTLASHGWLLQVPAVGWMIAGIRS